MTRHELPSQFVAEPPPRRPTAFDAQFGAIARNWEGEICDLAILADLTATLACDSLSTSKPLVTIDCAKAAHIVFCANDLSNRAQDFRTTYYGAWDTGQSDERRTSDQDPLVHLGVEFEAAWRDQVAIFARLLDDPSDAAGEACDAAYKKTMSIADKIEAEHAVSLEGLIVKARATSWCQQGSTFDDLSVFRQYGNSTTTDRRLAAAIIRDLISLSGAPLPEVPETEEQAKAVVAAADHAPVPRPDERLEALGRELDEVHAGRREHNLRDPFKENPHYDRHWELCAAINAIDATTIAGLQVKAKATACALRFDKDAECDVADSFQYLARSLAADVLRLGGGSDEATAEAIAFLAEPARVPEAEALSC